MKQFSEMAQQVLDLRNNSFQENDLLLGEAQSLHKQGVLSSWQYSLIEAALFPELFAKYLPSKREELKDGIEFWEKWQRTDPSKLTRPEKEALHVKAAELYIGSILSLPQWTEIKSKLGVDYENAIFGMVEREMAESATNPIRNIATHVLNWLSAQHNDNFRP